MNRLWGGSLWGCAGRRRAGPGLPWSYGPAVVVRVCGPGRGRSASGQPLGTNGRGGPVSALSLPSGLSTTRARNALISVSKSARDSKLR